MVGKPHFGKTQVMQSDWYRALTKYEKPHSGKAGWQLFNTFVPYITLWAIMVYMLQHGVPYWQVLPLALLASGFLVRIFIFFHDCGHGSFFSSRTLNRIVGYICGVLTFTPYEEWRLAHAGHHAHAADLERRGEGDIWTMTIEEFQAAPKRTQLAYRFYRNPLVLFVFGPPIMFMLLSRRPHKGADKRERMSIIITNLAILAILGLASVTIGLRAYLMIQIPVMGIAAIIGVWMFYVQHQYTGVYWARHDEWDPMRAALEGSSYYKLPKIFQWFSGNIGLHHIHHLRPRIPNYNLQKCYNEVPVFQEVKPITFWKSLAYMGLHLWDEKNQRLISFRELKRGSL
ncbi:fatty acid desaturase [Armatimonadota bacterium]|nr:fatty acid desaturase [Armatimonadota bacterium]